MNREMIRMWNETVKPGDLVYILGDLAFMSAGEAVSILDQLNGDKILIEGNHDKKLLRDAKFRSCFKEVHAYYEMTYNKTFVVMGHYPFLEWNRMHHGSVNLYGHVHGATTGMEKYRSRDVGMDATGKVVSLLDDVIADALQGEIKSHH